MKGAMIRGAAAVPPAPAGLSRRAIAPATGMTAEALHLMAAMQGRTPGGMAPGGPSDPLVLLAGIATASIDDPAVIRAETDRLAMAVAAAHHLTKVMGARNPRDLDLAVHRLRSVLVAVHRRSGFNVGPDLGDAALAPVLWRMAVLDRSFGSYLGIGLDALTRRAGLLLARHDCGRILNEAAARHLVDSLREAGAFIARPEARCDWSRALGPAGCN